LYKNNACQLDMAELEIQLIESDSRVKGTMYMFKMCVPLSKSIELKVYVQMFTEHNSIVSFY